MTHTLVPKEPTEAQCGGLARELVMWCRFDKPTGAALYAQLKSLGEEIPNWLAREIPNTGHVPPKGTVAACIYKAMLSAAPEPDAVKALVEATGSLLSHVKFELKDTGNAERAPWKSLIAKCDAALRPFLKEGE